VFMASDQSRNALRLSAEKAEVEAEYSRRIRTMGMRRLIALCAMFLFLVLGVVGMAQILSLYGRNGIAPEDSGEVYRVSLLVIIDAILLALAGVVRSYYQFQVVTLRREMAQFQALA
jgi:hypothetical protein